jgi:hypothetical protein
MEKNLRSYVEVVKKNMKEIEPLYHVKQFGIGRKITRGKVVKDEICLKFYVRYKAQPNELKAMGVEAIPPEMYGIKTDVYALPTGFSKRIMYLQATLPDDALHRPYPGGVATINANAFPIGTGTLGLIVRKKSGDTSGNLYGITNNHVGARESTTVNITAQKGDPWIQPGAHGNGQDPRDKIATLSEWGDMIPGGSGVNYYDFALGEITSESKREAKANEIMEIGRVEGTADVTLGDRVIKRGRTTRKRIGEVITVGLGNIQIPYQEGAAVCNFEDQIEVIGVPQTKEFSLGGDSGSIVCTESIPHRVVGLLFAGGTDPSGTDVTIYSPIQRIADEYNLEI